MPCYTIVESSVEFKVDNIEFLKEAIRKAGYLILNADEKEITIMDTTRGKLTISFAGSKLTGGNFTQTQLTGIANSIKRAYSERVIEEIAKKNKWLKKNMGQNRFQLQRF